MQSAAVFEESINIAAFAPRDKHSIPKAPEPANISKAELALNPKGSRLNIACLTRSVVGRVSVVLG